jgi:hypothetical protein
LFWVKSLLFIHATPFSHILVLHGIRPSMAKKKAAGEITCGLLGIWIKYLSYYINEIP